MTTVLNYLYAVEVKTNNKTEWFKLFCSEKDAQNYKRALLFVYEQDEVILWDKKDCHNRIVNILKEKDSSIAIFSHYPGEDFSLYQIPQYSSKEVM